MKILAVYNKKWVYVVAMDGDNAYYVSKTKATDGSVVGKLEKGNLKDFVIVDESLFAPTMMAVKGMDENGNVITYWQPESNVVRAFNGNEMTGVASKGKGSISSIVSD